MGQRRERGLLVWASARARRWALAAILLVATARPARAQAGTYVLPGDAAYDDLAVLVAQGLVTELTTGERPYARSMFGHFAREATQRLGTRRPSPRVREAIDRLAARFGGTAGMRVGVVAPTLTLAFADSPTRPVQAGYSEGVIDADLNPMLQRNGGRVLLDGQTSALEAGAFLEAGAVAAEVTGRAHGGGRPNDDPTGDVRLVTGYARAVAGPWSLAIGRQPMMVGVGASGGPMLTDNARPLDMIRVRTERPVRLPGFLGRLGQWHTSLSLSDLGSDRDQPRSKMVLTRISNKPSRFVELGFNYMNIQGGANAPVGTLEERFKDIFLSAFLDNGGTFFLSDKAAGADVRVTIPDAGLNAYVNFLTTDDRRRFRQPAGGYWEDAIWTVGMEQLGVGPGGRLDLRAEAQHTGPVPHTHWQFTSGVTLDRRVLGAPMGPSSRGALVEGTWTARRGRVRVLAELEEYTSDQRALRRVPGGGVLDLDWFFVSDGPEERRQRLSVEYLRFRGARGVEVGVRAGYERIDGFAFMPGVRHGVLGLLSLRGVR